MKKLFLLTAAWMISMTALMAQGDSYVEVAREVLKTEKKAVVAEAMMLTDEESGPFWELYNEYNAELYKVHTMEVNAIKDFANNFENMTDEKANQIWNDVQVYQTKLLKLQKTYYKKFAKIIPATKAVRYFQLENKIDALINAELALEIPLME